MIATCRDRRSSSPGVFQTSPGLRCRWATSSCLPEPKHLKFNGESTVRVKPAPPPSTLLWENQEISILSRVFRLTLAFFL